MPALEVMGADVELARGYDAPSCRAAGDARSVLFHPAGFSLWELEAELGASAVLRWDARHGDEVVFVCEGELEIDGVPCAAGGAAIIEAGVAATARAISDVRVLHFGPSTIDPPTGGPLGPPAADGHRVHVVRRDDTRRVGVDDGPGARYYADSTCETCRVGLLEVSAPGAHVVGSHVHSEDELIHVMTGELRIGRLTVAAGMTVAIPRGYRYGFRAPGEFSFLNYRRDVSMYVGAPGSSPVLETVEALRSR